MKKYFCYGLLKSTSKYNIMDIQQMKSYQREKSKSVIKHNIFNESNIKYIGGLDISFDKNDNDNACVYLSIYDYNSKKIVHEIYDIIRMKMPYISGLLGFREVPEYINLLNKLKSNNPELFPDILMVDGFGIYHHRYFGSASQLGVEYNIPTIGIAKNILILNDVDDQHVKSQYSLCKNRGDYVPIKSTANNFLYGVALKSSDAKNPIYVSIGHGIDLDTAIKITLNTCHNYKNPEPIRNSDIKSKLHL